MKLTKEVIKSYGFEERTYKPDWDDVAVEYTLPNGLVLSALSVCFNEPVEQDSLEGLNGYIYIETKGELDKLVEMSFEEIVQEVKRKDLDFDKENYI